MSTCLLDPKNAVSVYQGETKTFLILIDKPDPDNPGAYLPVDLTNATIYFTLKANIDSTDVIFQKVSTNPLQIEISDPRGGLARVFLLPEDTANLSTKKPYVFDVWVVLSGGERHPVIVPSTFRVLSAVTRIP